MRRVFNILTEIQYGCSIAMLGWLVAEWFGLHLWSQLTGVLVFCEMCFFSSLYRSVWHPRYWFQRYRYLRPINGDVTTVQQWCEDHCRGSWRIEHQIYIAFTRKSDAAMFTLFESV